MIVGIAYSINDAAGRGAAEKLVSMLRCSEVRIDRAVRGLRCLGSGFVAYIAGFHEDVLYLEFLDTVMPSEIEFYIVLSRHSARSAIPSLTVHTPGNPWHRADAGGSPWEVPLANPIFMWYALKALKELRESSKLNNFEVCYEVTHHGPTSPLKPITFVEIGSSEREWHLEEAHRVLAEGVRIALEELANTRGKPCKVSVGFGGPHYAPVFTHRALKYGECYGHILASYVLKDLSPEDLARACSLVIDRTPDRDQVVIEKIKSAYRRVIEEIARGKGVEVTRL